MSLLGFITGVGSIVGNVLGGKKTTQNTNQSTTGKQVTDSTSELATSGKSSQSQKGKSTQAQTGTTDSTGKTTTAGTTTMFSSDVLGQLNQLLTGQLSGGGQEQATEALTGRLSQLTDLASQPGFDVEKFASGITASAGADLESTLNSNINSMLSATGSSEQGNSMSALLGNKLRNRTAATLSGIESEANATGEQIRQQQEQSRTSQIGQLSGQISTDLSNLLGVSAGAQQKTTGTQLTEQQQIQDMLTKISESVNSKAEESAVAVKDESATTNTSQNTTGSTTQRERDGLGDIFKNIAGLFSGSQLAA